MPEHDIFDELAAEEPPIQGDDTNPSATQPRPSVDIDGSGGRLISGLLLLLSVAMIIGAVVLIVTNPNDENDNDTSVPVADQATDTIVNTKPSPSPLPTETNVPLPTAVAFSGPLPTVAADEQMLALLTPVPGQDAGSGVVQRNSVPFTEQIGIVQDTFVTYTVASGDTLDTITRRFDLDLCTLVWSNDRNRVSPLRPGNEITIPPVDGVYAKIRETTTIGQLAEETGVDPFAIIDSPYNSPALLDAQPDSILVEGIQVMVPGGNGGNCNIWGEKPSVVSSDGGNPSSNTGQYTLWGCSANVAGGGFPVTNPMGGRYSFFQGFSPSHTGVDLAADEGTPVYAAGLGTVVFAGWNNYGYGRTVVIAHGAHFTLYGHLSSIDVGCGQNVSSGQQIGRVGNTGRSSGPHLHFEIRDAAFNALDPVYTIGF